MRISDWSSDVCSSDLYLGSNVSYNVKKMVENGYLIQERSPHDSRSFHVRAAAKGIDVYRNLSTLFDQHAGHLNDIQLSSHGLDPANHALRLLPTYWSTPPIPPGKLTPAPRPQYPMGPFRP